MSSPPPAIIIPAHNEAAFLGDMLRALLASEGPKHAQLIIVPNGCRDETAQIARSFAATAAARNWSLEVIETALGDKLNALALADEAAAPGSMRLYLDADIDMSPKLIGAIVEALRTDAPRYASGQPQIAAAQSWVTRAYARFWQEVPFFTQDVPGFGIFAMNAAGRARWGRWEPMKSDDTFARLNFSPDERVMVPHWYRWPLTDGFRDLVRVRRRQNKAAREVLERWPELRKNDQTLPMRKRDVLRIALRDPAAFIVYALISAAVKTSLFEDGSHWARGR